MRGVMRRENGETVRSLNDDRHWDCVKASQDRLSPVTAVAEQGTLPREFFTWTDANSIDVPMSADELGKTRKPLCSKTHAVLVGFKITNASGGDEGRSEQSRNAQAVLGCVGWPENRPEIMYYELLHNPTAILGNAGHYLWRVHESFEFYLSDDSSDVISVPAGFSQRSPPCRTSSGQSCRQTANTLKNGNDPHDYLYGNALAHEKEANLIFWTE